MIHIKVPSCLKMGRSMWFEVVREGRMGQRGEVLVEEETAPTTAWGREEH